MRVLVSGSRYLEDELPVRKELTAVNTYAKSLGVDITLIHGDAPGADTIAAKIATEFGWDIEAFPANWALHGKSAGYIRNKAMIDSGVDMLYAFPHGVSKGTRMTIELAEKADINYIKVVEV